MVEKLGEITEREFRGIAPAGDTEATLQAMAAEILRYRHVGHVCFHCLRTLLSLENPVTSTTLSTHEVVL